MPMPAHQLRAHLRAALRDALRFGLDGHNCLRDYRLADAYWLAAKLSGEIA